MPAGEPNSIRRKVDRSEIAEKNIAAAGDSPLAKVMALNAELQKLSPNHNDVRKLLQQIVGLLVDIVTKGGPK